MKNRQKTKLSLLITTNEKKQKTEVARELIYIKWNIVESSGVGKLEF